MLVSVHSMWKKAKKQSDKQSGKILKIYIYIYIYISLSWRVFNTVENLSWSKVHRIWKRKSGKQGRKYLAKCLTRWKMIWSEIFDLMKAVFACETVRLLPAFSQKSLAINCRLFHEPHLSQITIPIELGFLFCQWHDWLRVFFDKSQFLWRLVPVQSIEKKIKKWKLAGQASEFYIHKNFQWLIKVTVVLDTF